MEPPQSRIVTVVVSDGIHLSSPVNVTVPIRTINDNPPMVIRTFLTVGKPSIRVSM